MTQLKDVMSEDDDKNIEKIIESYERGRFEIKGTKHLSAHKRVYEVIDTKDNGRKALKYVSTNQKDARKRAESEWNLWREINLGRDPTHVIRIFEAPIDFLEGYGTLMELAACSFQNLLDGYKKPNKLHCITEEEAIDYITQIGEGLKQGHLVGYSHNDGKPDNVLVVADPKTGEILLKVGDFANSTQGSHITTTNKGTLGYMGPEGKLMEGGKCQYEIRTDIYSLGVILFQCLHKDYKGPFEDVKGSIAELLSCQKQKGQTFIKEKLKEITASENTKQVILRCLKPNVSDRYPSVDDFLADLRKKPLIKPVTDIQDYQKFINVYTQLIGILDRENLHKGTQYNTASLEDIDHIQKGLSELLRLRDDISHKDLRGYEGDIISKTDPRIKEARDRREEEASKDKNQLWDVLIGLETQKSIGKIKFEDLKSKVIDIYKLVFCWGPPLANPESERGKGDYLGKERYSLDDIKRGVYLEAIGSDTKKSLGLM